MQFWVNVLTFFNSNFFVALTTLLTIGGGIYLYLRQKNENKQQIAILLINDIRNAQDAIQTVKDSLRNDSLIPEIVVLPDNNWGKYSYLFSKDLDQDEMRSINKFFSYAERINYIITQANNMFLLQITNRSKAMQESNLRIIETSRTVEEAVMRLNIFDTIFKDRRVSNSPYVPQGFYDSLDKYLPDMQDLLNSSAGKKFKQIAKLKN